MSKRLHFLWIALLMVEALVCNAEETNQAPMQQQVNSSTVFASTVAEPRSDENSQTAHADLLKKISQGKIDVYFIGDSITRRWGALDYPELLDHWNKHFYGWNAANFAWGGDRTQNILWRMQNGELTGANPKLFAVQAGTNNLNNEDNDQFQIDSITAGIIEIVRTAREKVPNAEVVITAVFPRRDNPRFNAIIDKINQNLHAFAEQNQLHYVDIGQRLVDEEGLLRVDMSDDGLHLNQNGYQVWAEALVPTFEEILGPRSETDEAPPATGNPAAR